MEDALPDDEEEGEDLFGNDMMDDYRHDPALDQYDSWMKHGYLHVGSTGQGCTDPF